MSTPINMSSLSRVLEYEMSKDARFSKCMVSRSASVNADPSFAVEGWIGVYRSSLRYDPRTLGRGGRNYTGTSRLYIVVQSTSLDSGEDAEESLEEHVMNVIDVLLNNEELRKKMDLIQDIRIAYSYNRTKETTIYFQEAVIEVTGTTKT